MRGLHRLLTNYRIESAMVAVNAPCVWSCSLHYPTCKYQSITMNISSVSYLLLENHHSFFCFFKACRDLTFCFCWALIRLACSLYSSVLGSRVFPTMSIIDSYKVIYSYKLVVHIKQLFVQNN